MAAYRQLGFDITGNCAIQSSDSENPTLEPNMKCIGSLVAEISHTLGAYGTPILRGSGGRRGSAMVPFETAMVVSYRLSIVTVTFGRNLRSNVSDAQSNRGWVTLGQNWYFRVFPLE